MPFAPQTLIIVLAHNEAECIGRTVTELRGQLGDADVLVVDDGSVDDTGQRALAAGAIVVTHPTNLGVAAGESTGLKYATRAGYAQAVRVDGDGQHDPASIPAIMRELALGADLVIGSRFLRGGTFESTALRRLGGRFLSRLLRLLSGVTVTDPTSGYRGFSAAAIALFARTHPHDYPEPESVLMARRKGLVVVEVAAKMRPRRTGQSSLTSWKSAFYMAKVSLALLLERARAS